MILVSTSTGLTMQFWVQHLKKSTSRCHLFIFWHNLLPAWHHSATGGILFQYHRSPFVGYQKNPAADMRWHHHHLTKKQISDKALIHGWEVAKIWEVKRCWTTKAKSLISASKNIITACWLRLSMFHNSQALLYEWSSELINQVRDLVWNVSVLRRMCEWYTVWLWFTLFSLPSDLSLQPWHRQA